MQQDNSLCECTYKCKIDCEKISCNCKKGCQRGYQCRIAGLHCTYLYGHCRGNLGNNVFVVADELHDPYSEEEDDLIVQEEVELILIKGIKTLERYFGSDKLILKYSRFDVSDRLHRKGFIFVLFILYLLLQNVHYF